MDTPKGECTGLIRMLDVPSAVNSAALTENMSARRLAVGEKKNIGATPGRDRQWPKIVHAYRNARPRREGNRKGRAIEPSVAVSPALGTSSNGATTSGCICSFLSTNRNA